MPWHPSHISARDLPRAGSPPAQAEADRTKAVVSVRAKAVVMLMSRGSYLVFMELERIVGGVSIEFLYSQ
jgi:hypothetical protein